MNRSTELLKEKTEAQLREWRGRIDAWQAKMDQHKLSAEEQSRETLASLREKVDDVRSRLNRLEHQGRDAGGDMRRQFDKAWKELEEAFEKARRRFDR